MGEEQQDAAVNDSSQVHEPDQDEDEDKDPIDHHHVETGKPTLSKSWSILSAHVPCYTGGKVVHCQRGIPLSSSSQGAATPTITSTIPFLLLSVDGDVALVHANRGTKITTVRGNDVIHKNDNDNDDDGNVDTEAITAFALSWNDEMIVTCSRNQLIHQYSISCRHETTSNNNPMEGDKTDTTTTTASQPVVGIQLTKTWGRSGHGLPVTQMEFHVSNVFLATGSVDGTVRIWDARGGFVTHVFRRPENTSTGNLGIVTSLSWRPKIENLILAIGRDDGGITIHDLRHEDNNNKSTVVLRDHVSAVTCIQWTKHPTGYLISAGRDAVVNTWKITTTTVPDKRKATEKLLKYTRIQTLPIYEQIEGLVVVVVPQEDIKGNVVAVATAGSKGVVRLWKAQVTNDTLGKFCLVSEQRSPFGEARGGYLQLCCLTQQPQQTSLDDNDDTTSNQRLLLVADAEHNLSFLSLESKHALETVRTIVGHNDEILDLRVIPTTTYSRQRIVVANNSAQVRLFDLESFSCKVLHGHDATVLCVDVSPCGTYVATCSKDKTVRIWHTTSESCIAVGAGHTEAIGATALSRKHGKYHVGGKAAINGAGAFCVSASKDRTLKRWNLPGSSVLDDAAANATNTEQVDSIMIQLKAFASARAHEKDINMVSVAPNDSLIASASQDKTLKLWKASDLSLVATLQGHRRGVWDCQFSPVDRVIASSSADRTVKVWSLTDFTCVRTFQGHVASVLRIRFLTGGLQLVSSGADGLIKLWTIRTMECEATFDRHNDKVWALDLSPDGTTMVSGGADSQILVWTDTTQHEEEVQRAKDEKDLLLEQQLANHLRRKEWQQALSICLDMDKPRQALKVFTAMIEDGSEGKHEKKQSKTMAHSAMTGLEVIQKQVETWPLTRTTQVLRYCREWNTRAVNSHIAMLVLQAIVTTVPAKVLAVTDGIPEILTGIAPYAERHFSRLDQLITNSHLIEYTLFCMGDLETTSTTTNNEDFANWEATSKLVLPQKQVDGRIQIGGKAFVGRKKPNAMEEDDVLSIGDSDSPDDDSENNSVGSDSDSRKVDNNRAMGKNDEQHAKSNAKERTSSSDDSESDSDPSET